jgi:branched-chain amino acid transport system permease protein
MTTIDIPPAAVPAPTSSARAHAVFGATARWRWEEIAFWLFAAACIVLFPTHLVLIAQVLITGLFALSFDLLVGYARCRPLAVRSSAQRARDHRRR